MPKMSGDRGDLTNKLEYISNADPTMLSDLFESMGGLDAVFLHSGPVGRMGRVGEAVGKNLSIAGSEPIAKFVLSEITDKWTAEKGLTALFEFWKKHQRKMPWGMVGYFSYDFGARLMGIKPKMTSDYRLPDIYFVIPSKVAVYDHNSGTLKSNFEPEKFSPGRTFNLEISNLSSNLSYKQYQESLKKIKRYLLEGETYQVNFSRRFEADFTGNPWLAFKRMTAINPSPFQVFFDFEGVKVASNSPERLVSGRWQEKNLVLESRPIKGTVGRGLTLEEDEDLKRWLINSSKDKAELNMIVDLVRNDLARVSRVGSIELNENRIIETYSHLHHTVSNVKSILQKGLDWRDVIRAIFPGGSITGCPKLRTMQIIDELEEFRRGLYCGSAGYISGDGSFDFNIMIRTLAFVGRRVYFNSGGGIVIDSSDRDEYEESEKKAAALVFSLSCNRNSKVKF